jgi:carboxyl-terminal processing protease
VRFPAPSWVGALLLAGLVVCAAAQEPRFDLPERPEPGQAEEPREPDTPPAKAEIVPAEDLEELDAILRRIAEVYTVMEEEAADPVNSYNAIYSGAIPGMLKRLDPHSIFFDPGQFEQLKEMQQATRKGFGSVVSILPGRVFILQTLPGSPSERFGLQPGDEILAINNIPLSRLSIDQLVGLLSESRRREAQLYIRRQGQSGLISITMVPEEMDSSSVDLSFFLRAGVAYIRAKSFEMDTARKTRDAIERMGGNDLRAVILDLRENRGGIMSTALETAALFLQPDQLIVSVRGRGTGAEEIRVPKDVESYTFPVAVLIGENSASGSEIVAGALQDHDRAVLVGTSSFGKGLVQQVYPLSNGTGLALTTAYYYTPSGRSIQRPLTGGQLTGSEPAPEPKEYYTDKGRPVRGGGGIHPDYVAYGEPLDRLLIVLEATGAYPSFATEAIRKLPPVESDFEVTDGLLDDFQVWLVERSIQPSITEWSTDREWIRSRLQQEVFNQTIGVDRGDQVEAMRDPQIIRALTALGLE